MKLIICS